MHYLQSFYSSTGGALHGTIPTSKSYCHTGTTAMLVIFY